MFAYLMLFIVGFSACSFAGFDEFYCPVHLNCTRVEEPAEKTNTYLTSSLTQPSTADIFPKTTFEGGLKVYETEDGLFSPTEFSFGIERNSVFFINNQSEFYVGYPFLAEKDRPAPIPGAKPTIIKTRYKVPQQKKRTPFSGSSVAKSPHQERQENEPFNIHSFNPSTRVFYPPQETVDSIADSIENRVPSIFCGISPKAPHPSSFHTPVQPQNQSQNQEERRVSHGISSSIHEAALALQKENSSGNAPQKKATQKALPKRFFYPKGSKVLEVCKSRSSQKYPKETVVELKLRKVDWDFVCYPCSQPSSGDGRGVLSQKKSGKKPLRTLSQRFR